MPQHETMYLIKSLLGSWSECTSLVWNRERLRDLARKNNVRRGRGQEETLANLKSAGVLIDLTEAKKLGQSKASFNAIMASITK